MENKIKFVYFDMGNVFCTFDKVFSRMEKDLKIDKEQIYSLEDKYDVKATLGKIDIPSVWQKICDELNIKSGKGYPVRLKSKKVCFF